MKKPRAGRRLSSLCRDQRGATAVEYGLILALIVLAVISGITALGSSVQQRWNQIADSVAGS